MAKKTETKKEAGKPKASTAKKAKRSQTKPKNENVVKQDVNVTEDVVEEILSTSTGQDDTVNKVVTDIAEQPMETIIDINKKARVTARVFVVYMVIYRFLRCVGGGTYHRYGIRHNGHSHSRICFRSRSCSYIHNHVRHLRSYRTWSCRYQ
jgi:hypothetical protein